MVTYFILMIASSAAAVDCSVNDSKLQKMFSQSVMGSDKPEMFGGENYGKAIQSRVQ